ncbi:MAG TPA: hypothetical protein PLW95_02375 [bacterium]|nr:hypothetical protein [bacterium]
MENVICPVCKKNEVEMEEKYGEFTLYKCRICTLEFFYPLSYKSSLYEEFYSFGYGNTVIKNKQKFPILFPYVLFNYIRFFNKFSDTSLLVIAR